MLNFCDFIQVCVFTTNHHLKLAESLPLKDYPSWQFTIMTDNTFAKLMHTTENKILYRSTLPKPGMHFSLYSMLHATYVL